MAVNIQQLRVVVELAKGKSLIEIGETLNITQPTVSFHIKKLEEELDIPLYKKEKRSLQLTPACLELVPYAEKILLLLDEAKVKMQTVHDLEQPTLKISASYTPATYYLPPFIRQFKKEHANIDVSLSTNQARTSIQLLKEHRIDLAIVSLQHFNVEGLNIHPLVEDKLLLTFSAQSHLAKLSTINIDDLHEEIFLLHEEGSTSRMVTNEWSKQNKLLMKNRNELASIEKIKDAVILGEGIGILPEKSIERELREGILKAIPLPNYDYRRCICLAYRNEDYVSPQVNEFIWFAIENMK